MQRLAVLGIALGLVALATQVARAESATVRISPASQSVPRGETAQLELQVDTITDADGVGSLEFAFNFDPNVLTFQSFASTDYLGSTGRTVTCLAPLLDRDGDGVDDPGYVRFGCVTQGELGQPGPTTNGTLATVIFETKCPGTSTLEYDRASISDPLGNGIDLGSIEGSITVTGTPCTPPPTATPEIEVGDANCDGHVTAVDAALILQFNAGLVRVLACEDAADVNGDGHVNAVDAALVLQFTAGLIDHF